MSGDGGGDGADLGAGGTGDGGSAPADTGRRRGPRPGRAAAADPGPATAAVGPGPAGTAPAQGRPPAGLHEHGVPEAPPRPGLGALAAVVLAVVAGAALWAALAGTGPARVDGALLGESVEARTGALTAAAVVLTTVGNTFAMAVLATLSGIRCWMRGRRADAVLVVGAMAGASLVFRALKVLLDRPRPPAATRLVAETNQSLPSGHATMSMVVIGSLVVLAWAGRTALARLGIAAAAALWIGAVGATRVYLGVHWFSDVLAGWLVGAAWLALCVGLWSWWRARPQPTGPPRTGLRRATRSSLSRNRGS